MGKKNKNLLRRNEVNKSDTHLYSFFFLLYFLSFPKANHVSSHCGKQNENLKLEINKKEDRKANKTKL